MKKTLSLLFLSICVFTLSGYAQNFSLLKDINTNKDANPVSIINDLYLASGSLFYAYSSYNSACTVVNGVAYFSADDGIHGTELWRSNNTAAGTYMVKDIATGSGSSEIQSITKVGNKIFFTANQVVYMSDGTEAGTVAVPGIIYNGDQTTCLTAVGNTLYFFAAVSRLWKTDGTAAGTSLVIDFRNNYFGSKDFLGQLTNVNGTLFFTVGFNNESGVELWKSDGTAGGTVMVKDINPGTGSSLPIHLTPVGAKLYFSANDGSGTRLWVSDGTAEGTKAVKNSSGALLPDPVSNNSNDIMPFAVLNKTLYFKALTIDAGGELFSYNTGNPSAGISLVRDIVAGVGTSNPANITATDSLLYFSVANGAGERLYKSNGTNQGTVLVKQMELSGNYLSNFTNANGILLFSNYTSKYGYELWSSNGTNSGTKMIKDIYPAQYSSAPVTITYLKNNISLFNATDGSAGRELWSTDGTKAGTALVKNMNITTTAGSNPMLGIGFIEAVYANNKSFFTAVDPVYGSSLFVSDNTAAGTASFDLNSGSASKPANLTVFKNNVYFSATSGGYNTVYKSNGTAGGTTPVFNSGDEKAIVRRIFAAGNYIYVFYKNPDSSTAGLWVSNGTAAGSKKIQTVATQDFFSGAAVGDTLYFNGFDSTHGTELWLATQTPGSAHLVKDILPGSIGSGASSFVAFKNKLYFIVNDTLYKRFVYVSNGTAGGTKRLLNVQTNSDRIVTANDKLYFSALDAAAGNELFISTGTTAGTKLLKDIYAGISGSNPNYLTAMNDVVYFSADDGVNGNELWKTSGTAGSTRLVKNIAPGSQGSYPYNLAVAGDELFFTAGGLSQKMFYSNGTGNGTAELADAGLSGVFIYYYKGVGDKLFINGYTYAYGNELYTGSIPAATQKISNAIAKNITPSNFSAVVLGNPVTNKIVISVNADKAQNALVVVTDASGKILFNHKEYITTGISNISIPANTLAAGIYTLKIVADDGSSVELKVVK